MLKRILLLVALTLVAPALMADGTLINLEEAAEVSALRIRLQGTGTALVYARICDRCPMLTLRLDANTQIRRGRRALTLEQAAALDDRGATLLFDPATKNVTRVIYWN